MDEDNEKGIQDNKCGKDKKEHNGAKRRNSIYNVIFTTIDRTHSNYKYSRLVKIKIE